MNLNTQDLIKKVNLVTINLLNWLLKLKKVNFKILKLKQSFKQLIFKRVSFVRFTFLDSNKNFSNNVWKNSYVKPKLCSFSNTG